MTQRIFGVVFVALVLSACSSAAQSPRQAAGSTSSVVATIGSTPVTLAEIDEKALQASTADFGSVRLSQALYLARRAALDELIADHLIAAEARSRGIEADALLKLEVDSKVQTPSDEDVAFWYQANPSAVQGRPLDQLRTAIRALLAEQRLSEARNTLVDALKAKTAVVVSLEPPRQQIATDRSEAKGPKDAPIVMVEFSDFQCPFCQRAHPTVERVLQTYGDKIRFVYRHLPLPNHPAARPAAEASACAALQGQFWPYHDRLFANPNALSNADLKAHAAALKLDTAKFAACVDSRQTKDDVDRDLRDASEAGISATPSFFINGRSIDGAQPFDAFKRIIDEELAATGKR